MSKKNHSFHLVDYSPWPLFGAFSTMIMMSGTVKWFHYNNNNLFLLGLLIILLIMFQWWRDIIRESTFLGFHTLSVTKGIRWGMILFITSEIFFFLSFFWAFFHSSLSPSIEIGGIWPPKAIQPFNPMNIPLLNTMILISSGATITWSHHSMMNMNFKETIISLTFTIILGIFFSIMQGFEYLEAPFTMADSIYGSTFFMATGFHGIHVLIGTIFLIINLIRLMKNHFSIFHHFGFEAAIWYWHFVDVVWLFLYISMYWWGSN
uniref:Cytochrome c oxidase subunit 3 n=1 Tax=Megabeleses liriodendrovorax TaxID=2735432 RepID=A0A8F0WHA1_9HYME|nr:cytochrome c oxidase subunit III [Megabeleses liriodendrovorax]QWM93816.1 cytochrome c oxidase subunit III [Megabeleses liriodendrovorax]